MMCVFSKSSQRWILNHSSSGRLIWAMIVGVWLVASPAYGAEIRGRISLPSGQAVANAPIAIGSREIGRTDASGVYSLDLPPGRHVFTVRGQNVEVWVSPHGNRQDVQLK